jgi:hypothetical protein
MLLPGAPRSVTLGVLYLYALGILFRLAKWSDITMLLSRKPDR